MAVVKGPLFSIGASGTVGGAIVYSTWKGRPYVRQHAVPANPQSVGQKSVRALMQFLTQDWTNLSANEKADWETRAAVTNISAFNAFIAYNMARWGIYDYPSIPDPAAEDDSAGTITLDDVVNGVRSLTVEFTVTVLAQNWGVAIHRSESTGFTPGRNNVVHAMRADSAASFEWVDTPLTPGTQYYYRLTSFSEHGVSDTLVTEDSGTPTAS